MYITFFIFLSLAILSAIPSVFMVVILASSKRAYTHRDDSFKCASTNRYTFKIDGKMTEYFVSKDKVNISNGIYVYRSNPKSGHFISTDLTDWSLTIMLNTVCLISIVMIFTNNKLLCLMYVVIALCCWYAFAKSMYEYYSISAVYDLYSERDDLIDCLQFLYYKPFYNTWWYQPVQAFLATVAILALVSLFVPVHIVGTVSDFAESFDAVFPTLYPRAIISAYNASQSLATLSAADKFQVNMGLIRYLIAVIYIITYVLRICPRRYFMYLRFSRKMGEHCNE